MFNYERNRDIVNYALKLSPIAKYLYTPMMESEISLNIARYYNSEFVETITIQNIKNMEQFIQF